MATDVLANVKFIKEKRLISSFFDEIAQDTGKYCFGVKDTLKVLKHVLEQTDTSRPWKWVRLKHSLYGRILKLCVLRLETILQKVI